MSHYIFPTIFVINLDERQDRWLTIQKMCRQFGIHAERVSAVKKSPGWQGCALSHVKCAKMAKERNLPWVLVLEDDCTFSSQEWQHFVSLLPFLWKTRTNWKYFNGGPTFMRDLELFDSPNKLVKAHSLATHFIFYTKDAYNTILEWTPNHAQIDVYFDNTFKPISPYPVIAHQLPSYSDITASEVDYESFVAESNNAMESFLKQNNAM